MKTKIITLIYLILFSIGAFAQKYVEKFRETSAIFTIMKTDAKNIKPNSVLAMLIKASGQELGGILDETGTKVVSFEVKYSAPVEFTGEAAAKPHQIIQYGLYNNLNSELKPILGKAMESPINIKIGYNEHDPIDIQFIVNKKLYQPTVLLTDE